MDIVLGRTLQIVMSFSYRVDHPKNCVGRVPQFILVNDCVLAQAEDLEVATEKKPRERKEMLQRAPD